MAHVKKQKLSQDEMIKNLLRDYPQEALEFFNPEIIERYGRPENIQIHIQERKKHSHYDPNLKHDISIIFELKLFCSKLLEWLCKFPKIEPILSFT